MNKKTGKMNKVAIGLTIFSVSVLFFVLFAENVGAVLLEPLPGAEGADKNPGIYIKAIYNITIGLAGVLAVLMLVWGGIEYIASAANPSLKASAKKRIWSAIGGLLLALSAFIILKTINPKLVNFGFGLSKINTPDKVPPQKPNPGELSGRPGCYIKKCKLYMSYGGSVTDAKNGKNICNEKVSKIKGCGVSFKRCVEGIVSCNLKKY